MRTPATFSRSSSDHELPQNKKSTLKGCLSPLRPKSFRRNVCNPPLVAVWNCDKVAYGIKPQGDAYTRLRVMPYAFGDSIQCASALIPCQACGLDKKITSEQKSSDVIFFGDSWENRTPVSALRGPCLSRLTNEPYSRCLIIIQQKVLFVNSFFKKNCKKIVVLFICSALRHF